MKAKKTTKGKKTTSEFPAWVHKCAREKWWCCTCNKLATHTPKSLVHVSVRDRVKLVCKCGESVTVARCAPRGEVHRMFVSPGGLQFSNGLSVIFIPWSEIAVAGAVEECDRTIVHLERNRQNECLSFSLDDVLAEVEDKLSEGMGVRDTTFAYMIEGAMDALTVMRGPLYEIAKRVQELSALVKAK